MEISNRALGITAATFLLFGISMRVQSGSNGPASQTTANVGSAPPRAIPDSDFNILSQYQTVSQVPVDTKLGGTPNKNLINLNQAGAIVPGVTRVEDDSQPVAMQTASNPDPSANQDYDSSANDQPPSMTINVTGNTMIDAAAGTLPAEDQMGFQMMWSGMNPAQKQQFMDNLNH